MIILHRLRMACLLVSMGTSSVMPKASREAGVAAAVIGTAVAATGVATAWWGQRTLNYAAALERSGGHIGDEQKLSRAVTAQKAGPTMVAAGAVVAVAGAMAAAAGTSGTGVPETDDTRHDHLPTVSPIIIPDVPAPVVPYADLPPAERRVMDQVVADISKDCTNAETSKDKLQPVVDAALRGHPVALGLLAGLNALDQVVDEDTLATLVTLIDEKAPNCYVGVAVGDARKKMRAMTTIVNAVARLRRRAIAAREYREAVYASYPFVAATDSEPNADWFARLVLEPQNGVLPKDSQTRAAVAQAIKNLQLLPAVSRVDCVIQLRALKDVLYKIEKPEAQQMVRELLDVIKAIGDNFDAAEKVEYKKRRDEWLQQKSTVEKHLKKGNEATLLSSISPGSHTYKMLLEGAEQHGASLSASHKMLRERFPLFAAAKTPLGKAYALAYCALELEIERSALHEGCRFRGAWRDSRPILETSEALKEKLRALYKELEQPQKETLASLVMHLVAQHQRKTSPTQQARCLLGDYTVPAVEGLLPTKDEIPRMTRAAMAVLGSPSDQYTPAFVKGAYCERMLTAQCRMLRQSGEANLAASIERL